MAALGVAFGVVGSLLLNRLIASLLFDLEASDPITFITVALSLSAVALLALVVPAHRATSVDPMVALRYE